MITRNLSHYEPLKRINNQNLFRKGSFVAGKWIESDNTLNVVNPCTEEIVTTVSTAEKIHVQNAINEAHYAFTSFWKYESPSLRSKILKELSTLHRENLDDLALLLSLESGKPLHESKGEILYSISYFDWFSEEVNRVYGDILRDSSSNQIINIEKEPLGLCAFITPWNFPSAMLSRKIAAALCVGCSVIAKPASETPLSALAICSLFEQVIKNLNLDSKYLTLLNIVIMDGPQFTEVIMNDSRVKKISFTGSTKIGKMLMSKSSQTLKKLSLELGGNAPFIIFDTHKKEPEERNKYFKSAVKALLQSKFRNSGQTCICLNRLYVQNNVKEEFLNLLKEKLDEMNIKESLDFDKSRTCVSALISKEAISKCEGFVKDAVEKGATVSWTYRGSIPSRGYYMKPVLLNNCTSGMKVVDEEIFGPIIPVVGFDTAEEVISEANSTSAGLAAYFFSDDISQIEYVKQRLDFGMIGVNTGNISSANLPFGGMKESGFGREGSKYGVDDYITLKASTMKHTF